LIVIACNTISAAALRGLRQQFPAVPFVGMEPAIKPAAAHTRTRTIGVLATSATFQGELFASVVERFANNVTLINQVGWGLVEQVEQGRLDTPDTIVLLEKCLKPILAAGADSIVLGCTHYPFLLPAIQRLVGPTLEVIDPAPAVARRVKQLAEQYATLLTTHAGQHVFYTTGGTQNFSELLNCLAGVKNGDIRAAQWRGNEIVE
jgi:glutamate racemase